MSERIPCEFFLIRYVPDVVKGEFTNVGVLLRPLESSRVAHDQRARMLVRFTRDWSRVLCVDPDADVALLEAMEEEIAGRLNSQSSAIASEKPLISTLADTLSNSIQITEARACLAETIASELDQLMRLYVEPMRTIRVSRQKTGRAGIVESMRKEFEHTGVWTVMKKRIAVWPYTRRGDPMKIDCGYRPNGIVRMFHAVSLDTEIEPAKGLAYSVSRLREGMLRVDHTELELTAVVEPLRSILGRSAVAKNNEDDGDEFESEAASLYRFGVEAMEQQLIRVITVNDLARAAETARIELKM